VGKDIPDTDLLGIIKKLSVNLTPIKSSALPKSENNCFCCCIGHKSWPPAPGAIDEVSPRAYFFFK